MPPPIRGFLENTLLDWEGKLAAIVFLPGCSFRCPYCHARHLVERSSFDENIPLPAVLASLRAQKGWLDGVVISGGEPTFHPDLVELILLFRAQGLPVKLDTNGARPDVLRDLLERRIINYVAMDIKAPLDERYRELCGPEVNLDALRSSISLIIHGGVPYEFRTTVCPAFTGPSEIRGIGRAVRGAQLLYLQPFRPVNCLDPALHKVKPYNLDEMRELRALAAPYVRRCACRGDTAAEPETAEILQNSYSPDIYLT